MDIFQIFHLQTREDKYTFVLCEFLNNAGFRNKAKAFFGFDRADFCCIRESFALENPTTDRKKVTPDMILYNNERVAVIESKMFSSEGYMQTEDYKSAEDTLLAAINEKQPSSKKRAIDYYYLTLTGMLARNSCFQPIYWSDFYVATLTDTDFQDDTLNLLAGAIRSQASEYHRLVSADNLKNLLYDDLFSDTTYWIRPYSLFASGVNNELWGLTATDYHIYNGNITGQGHSDFTTNFKKTSWYKLGEQTCDTAHLFIRCEWAKSGLSLYLNWENFDPQSQISRDGIVIDYIATKSLSADIQKQTVQNKHHYMNQWQKPDYIKNIAITNKKDAVLRILKCTIDCKNRPIEDVLKEAAQVIAYYEKEILHILDALKPKNGLLVYCPGSSPIRKSAE